MRVVAVDWSGALEGSRRKIWLAEVVDGKLVRLENGRSREQMADHLIHLAHDDSDLIVGLDFAFSAPKWFLSNLGLKSVGELWQLARTESEGWLTRAETPFWRRTRPTGIEHFRKTDLIDVKGIRPTSIFQLVGASQVGPGSRRGWPVLASLHAAGFSVWPFTNGGLPVIVEIYPRLLTGTVVKSSEPARKAYLLESFPELTAQQAATAVSNDDAFDAAISALVMYRHLDELVTLPPVIDDDHLMEGIIWGPKRI